MAPLLAPSVPEWERLLEAVRRNEAIPADRDFETGLAPVARGLLAGGIPEAKAAAAGAGAPLSLLREDFLMAIHARPRVLVVDDQLTGRLAMEMHLARWDLEVIQAHNGQDAVNRCAEERFDLIFMDLHMPPGIDGIETTRWIRRQGGDNARVPVIVYTSDAAYADRQVWSDAGFDGYIFKAVTDAALVEVLDRWKLLENR